MPRREQARLARRTSLRRAGGSRSLPAPLLGYHAQRPGVWAAFCLGVIAARNWHKRRPDRLARETNLETWVLSPLHDIASDLSRALTPERRLHRLVCGVARALPCDSVALLGLDAAELVPLASTGLLPDVRRRRFRVDDHPRLRCFLDAEHALQFQDHGVPDPFDGLLLAAPNLPSSVHACMGCPVVVDGQVVGVLAVDALDETAFDRVDATLVATLAALSGAALRAAARGGSASPSAPVAERPGASLAQLRDAYLRHVVKGAVARANGNWAEAARALLVNRGNLRRLGKRLGLLGP